MAYPKIGNMAPAFRLQDSNGDAVSLKDFRGKRNVVVYFYPRAMTPGCTTQACGIRDSGKQFAALNTVVLGISPDGVAKLGRFADKHELDFPLLSDEDHAVAQLYGVWGPRKFMGREFVGIHRNTFIVDSDGRLRHIIDKVKTKTHHDDVLQWISEHLA